MRITPLLVAVGLLAGITTVSATTASYYDKGYDFASLKTFDFKTQRRISKDPIANNQIWAEQLHTAIQRELQDHGYQYKPTDHADFMVADYVGLKEGYDVRVMDYGFPGFWGRGRFGWHWGWPDNFDVWKIPYTDSTLIIDLIDGQTNQLVWRGFNTDTINLKKPEHDFKDAVNDVLSKFFKDAKEQRT